MAIERKKSELGKIVREAAQKAGVSIQELADKAGVPRTVLGGMIYGGVVSIQKDLALKIARITKSDTSIFQPYLSDKAPRGTLKKVMKRKQAKAESVFTVACPHCEGSGKINVRKV